MTDSQITTAKGHIDEALAILGKAGISPVTSIPRSKCLAVISLVRAINTLTEPDVPEFSATLMTEESLAVILKLKLADVAPPRLFNALNRMKVYQLVVNQQGEPIKITNSPLKDLAELVDILNSCVPSSEGFSHGEGLAKFTGFNRTLNQALEDLFHGLGLDWRGITLTSNLRTAVGRNHVSEIFTALSSSKSLNKLKDRDLSSLPNCRELLATPLNYLGLDPEIVKRFEKTEVLEGDQVCNLDTLGDLIQIDPERDQRKICFGNCHILEIAEKLLGCGLFFGMRASEIQLQSVGARKIVPHRYRYDPLPLS